MGLLLRSVSTFSLKRNIWKGKKGKSTDSLLGLEVSELSSIKISRGTALLEEDSSLSSSVGREPTTASLLDSGFGSSMSLDTRETSGRSKVTPDNSLLGTDHISSSGDIRDREEPSSSVTVRVVGAGSGGEASWELGGGKGGGSKGKNKEKHLD